jgi:sRNA-binding regulator protein Hfq
VKDFGTYSLLVETRGGRELVFKHGIISIRLLAAGAR